METLTVHLNGFAHENFEAMQERIRELEHAGRDELVDIASEYCYRSELEELSKLEVIFEILDAEDLLV